jgi:prolipoprotein diacylglyceryltransferase
VVRAGCLGTASNLPWAYSQPGSATTRHPVEIYAALALIVLAAALVMWKRARPAPGVISGIALLGAALVRFATEPMRPGIGGDLFWWYAAGAIGAAALVVWHWRRPAQPHSRTL